MSRSVSSSSRQLHWPPPTPSESPSLSAFPFSRSSELKCRLESAPMDRVIGPASLPLSSMAVMSTSPARSERLTIRMKPMRAGLPAGRTSGRECTAARPVETNAVEPSSAMHARADHELPVKFRIIARPPRGQGSISGQGRECSARPATRLAHPSPHPSPIGQFPADSSPDRPPSGFRARCSSLSRRDGPSPTHSKNAKSSVLLNGNRCAPGEFSTPRYRRSALCMCFG